MRREREIVAPKPEQHKSALPDIDIPFDHGPGQNYSGHYLHATPSPVPAIAGLLVALALLAFGIAETRTGVSKHSSLQVAAPGSAVTEGAAVVGVAAEQWFLNGQPVEETDLLFRLSGAAGRSPVVIIEHTAGLSATRLTRALEMVNKAGFSQVGVRAMENVD